MYECAKTSIEAHNPGIEWGKDIIVSFDLMVLKVFQEGGNQARIEQYQADVPDFTFTAIGKSYNDLKTPKYHDSYGNGDPYAQIDISTQIPSCDDGKGNCNYRDDGY